MPRLTVKEDRITHSDALVNELRRSIMAVLLEQEVRIPRDYYLEKFDEAFSGYKQSRLSLFRSVCAKRLRKDPGDISADSGGPAEYIISAGRMRASNHRLSELIDTVVGAALGYKADGGLENRSLIDAYNWKNPLSFEVELAGDVTITEDDLASIQRKALGLLEKLYPNGYAPVAGGFDSISPDREASMREFAEIKNRVNTVVKYWDRRAGESAAGSIKALLAVECDKVIDNSKGWHGDEKRHASMIERMVRDETERKVDALGWKNKRVTIETKPL